MRKNIRRKHEAHRRAQAVCNEFRAVIEASEAGTKRRAQLDASVEDVERHFTEQQHALNQRRVASAQRNEARRMIRDLIKPVVDISAVVQLDEGSAKVVRLPDYGSDELLIADANAIADVLSAHAAAFKAEGLPDNVLADLRKQIASLKKAKAANSSARRAFSAAARSAVNGLRSGDEAIAVIDAMLSPSPDVDAQALTKLREAKRVGPGRPAEKPAAEGDPAQTAPTKVA